MAPPSAGGLTRGHEGDLTKAPTPMVEHARRMLLDRLRDRESRTCRYGLESQRRVLTCCLAHVRWFRGEIGQTPRVIDERNKARDRIRSCARRRPTRPLHEDYAGDASRRRRHSPQCRAEPCSECRARSTNGTLLGPSHVVSRLGTHRAKLGADGTSAVNLQGICRRYVRSPETTSYLRLSFQVRARRPRSRDPRRREGLLERIGGALALVVASRGSVEPRPTSCVSPSQPHPFES